MKQTKRSVLKFFTLCLFFLMLFYAFFTAIKSTSQSHFNIPEDRKVYILPTRAPVPSPTPDPITSFREDRKEQFSAISTILTELANNPSASSDLRALSQEKLMEHEENERMTLLIETALQGMGYPDAVCAVHSKTASVFLASSINENEGQLLSDLIREWTGLPASSIRLIQTP